MHAIYRNMHHINCLCKNPTQAVNVVQKIVIALGVAIWRFKAL